jgi:folate-binding protein YgfZ
MHMPESALSAAVRADRGAGVVIDGWTVAADFGDAAGEYRRLRDDAALVDLAFRVRRTIHGADRADFLQGMLSNDVKALGPGDGCAALLLTEQGKVVADAVVLALPDVFLLDTAAGVVAKAVAALERYVVADDVTIAAVDEEDHAIGIYGPAADAALGRLGITAAPTVPYAHTSVAGLGVPVRLVRVPAPGAGGVVCLVPRAHAAEWWARCIAAAVAPAGFTAFDVLRIESGTPCYGRDVGPETIALEAPFESAVSFRKGCYLGQEIVERVTARGHVNRKLRGLTLDGTVVPAAGAVVLAGEHEVGRVTSAAWSWRLDRPVALAYVRREHLAPGSVLAVRDAAGTVAATVRELPLV